jgi:hypothetical protein
MFFILLFSNNGQLRERIASSSNSVTVSQLSLRLHFQHDQMSVQKYTLALKANQHADYVLKYKELALKKAVK